MEAMQDHNTVPFVLIKRIRSIFILNHWSHRAAHSDPGYMWWNLLVKDH